MIASTPPLPELLRPKKLEEMVGQQHLLKENGWISRSIASKRPLSLLLWGPPGCGKTSLARLYAKEFEADFLSFSAVLQGSGELKKMIQDRRHSPLFSKPLILFIDEIHRFNKAQQDALLPFVESGEITLIGATTENPSFSVNNALLSRLHTLTLSALTKQDLLQLYERSRDRVGPLPLSEEAVDLLIDLSLGDGRHLLNMVEALLDAPKGEELTAETLPHYVQRRAPLFDKGDEGHYNLISALHKAVRGSDPDAALYYLARMIVGGCDPNFLGRRIVRMASEDIGLADPNALAVALSAWKAFDQLGSPEGELALAQAVLYLALAPKSNASYTAFKEALQKAKETGHLSPPKTILNAPTSWMKGEGYGKGYQYDHDEKEGFSGQNYFPEEMERAIFYEPVERGFEREMKKRAAYFSALRAKKQPSR